MLAAEKTADAAKAGNYVAGIGALLSFISIILVLVAIGQTRRAHGLAENASQLQLRAYPDFDGVAFARMAGAHRPNYVTRRIEIKIRNFGQTPARDVNFSVTYAIIGSRGSEAFISIERGQGAFGSISPKDHVTYRGALHIPNEIWVRIIGDEVQFRVNVLVTFTDAFDENRTLESSFDSHGDKDDFSFVEGTRKVE